MISLKQFVLVTLVLGGSTSCTYDNPLSVSSQTPSVTVFYGTVTDSNDDKFTGPGFIYGPVTLRWNGDKPLNLINLVISFPKSGKLSADTNCSFDSQKLEDAFTAATNLILQPNVTYTSAGRFICTGITAENLKDKFIVAGSTKIRGFTGGATDQKIYKAETKVFFYWYPQNE